MESSSYCSGNQMMVTVNDMLIKILCLFLFCFPFLCSARDNITWNSSISDDFQGETLVSAGGRFELGFFTPNGSLHSRSRRRYVGIWYNGSNPRTVVWVANRKNPLDDSNGVLAIAEDGNAKVFGRKNKSYWSTKRGRNASYMNRILKLQDSGNLVLIEEDRINQTVIWQSFDYPTDTFLPGMKMGKDMVLTSWRASDDPGLGRFTFHQDHDGLNQYTIRKEKSIKYWQSKVSGDFIDSNEDEILAAIFSGDFTFENRLVMDQSGKIQFYYTFWTNDTTFLWDPWMLYWSEPRNRCSVYNACGNFGICNSRTRSLCKCLPGFQPKFPEKWRSRDFSDGCERVSSICVENVGSDNFMSLKMMKVGKEKDSFTVSNETECANDCLHKCDCQAYSYAENITRRARYDNPGLCRIWGDIDNIWENFTGGRDLSVRVAASDIGSKKRSCETCGTNTIPYPLSTGRNCGDPLYYSFYCNKENGSLSFMSPNRSYRVIRINQERLTFAVQAPDTLTCSSIDSAGKILQLDPFLPFKVSSGCNESSNSTSYPLFEDTVIKEIEIRWDPPLEPTCSSLEVCTDWKHTTCKVREKGDSKCLCNERYRWDGFKLNCASVHKPDEEGPSQKKNQKPSYLIFEGILATVIAILCITCFVYYLKRRRVANRQDNRGSNQGSIALHLYDTERRVQDLLDSSEFREDDKKDIDVPFFDLASILGATDNFSEANKLGQGGFGPVYKGKFLGGQLIAIKRLSRGSGQGLEEFKNEVLLIAKLQHRNLVRLLGYCIDRDEKMLLYEYMPNKSLDSFLFDRTLCVLLNWEIRFNIILGIARGLLYLHQDSRLRIIHRDLKTSNVLLDEEMNPKISDFGLARIFGGKQTEGTTTRVVGTYGYMSPEYALDGFFSVKSDAFSFGVVVLEVISGKRNTGFFQSKKALSLLGYSWKLWKENRALDLMDQTLRESCNTSEFLRCVNVGLLCVQEDPTDRPTMSNVVFMLGSETATLPTPKQPAFVVRRSLSSTASSSSKAERINELTATIEEAR